MALLSIVGCATRSGERSAGSYVERVSTTYELQTHVVYTPIHWPCELTGDLYLPELDHSAPAIVTIHGGGWDARDRSDMEPVARKLASRGYAVLNIDYRLAPKYLFPAQLDDVREAIRWLRFNAVRLKIDAERIGAWGYSAGGHLATLAATEDVDSASRIEAVVSGGTPADLPHYPHSPIITRFLGKTFAEAPKTWTAASPLAHVTPRAPPMFLYHGTWDGLVAVEDSVNLHSALVQAGVPAELYLIHGAGHIATFLFGFGAEGAGIDFLDSVLRRDPAAPQAATTGRWVAAPAETRNFTASQNAVRHRPSPWLAPLRDHAVAPA